MSNNLQWALYYASRGWAVFPVFPMRNGKCACGGRPRCAPGKHPINSNGRNGATLDSAQITSWWSGEWVDANIGIATGKESSLLVVDLDDKDDGTRKRMGSKAFGALVERNGNDFGAPLVAISGSGGKHLYYSTMDTHGFHVDVGNSQSDVGLDVDIRGSGGYIIAPPSNHESGGVYDWKQGALDLVPSSAPNWLVIAAQSSSKSQSLPTAEKPDDVPYHTLTREDVEEYMEQARDDKAYIADALLSGLELAPNGKRHSVVRDFTASLWMYIRKTRGAWVHPTESYGVFEASCKTMEATAKSVIPDMHWIAGMFCTFAPKGEGIIQNERALVADMSDFKADVEARMGGALKERVEDLREDEEAIQRAFGTDRTTPYTPDELQEMYPTKKRWVLGTTAGYFLRAPGGDYIGPYTRELLPTKARDILAPAWTADVRLKELTDRGETRLFSMAEIMDRYGQVPSRMCYSYLVEKSGLDDSLTFVQRAARPRDWAAEYNPQIDKWLRLFAGSDEQAEALMDWLATLLDLSRPTAALCIMGTSGAGKDLFADGLREVWGARMAFHHAIDHFNGGLIDTPLVFANEEVKAPRDFKGSVAEALKEMIASDSRSVQNKYAHAVDLYGSVRVVIATNSQGVLKFDRQPNSDDIQALEDRIILLRPSEPCRQYVIDIGGRDTTEAWVRGGGFPRHIAWLQANRKVKPGPRFIVQGSGGMAEVLAADGRGAAIILRAYLTALLGPVAIEPKVANYWEGEFWFSPRNLKDRWATYGGKDAFPEDMAAVTSVICEPEPRGEKPRQRKVDGEGVRMRRIKWPVLLRAAQSEDRLDELLGLKAQ